MTLVEVVVALAVFATMTLAITMAFSAAIKYNTRNIRRDYELTLQQEAVERASAAGVEVYNGAYGSHKAVFTKPDGGTLFELSNITEYNAVKSAQNGSDFNFELKTFSSVPLGATDCTFDKDKQQYKISIVNESASSVDITIKTTGGAIYEGDINNNPYKHSSNLYRHSILGVGEADEFETEADESGNPTTASPQGFIIGFNNEGDTNFSSNGSYMTIEFNVDGFAFEYTEIVRNDLLAASATGHLAFTIHEDKTITSNYNAPV